MKKMKMWLDLRLGLGRWRVFKDCLGIDNAENLLIGFSIRAWGTPLEPCVCGLEMCSINKGNLLRGQASNKRRDSEKFHGMKHHGHCCCCLGVLLLVIYVCSGLRLDEWIMWYCIVFRSIGLLGFEKWSTSLLSKQTP